MATTGQDRKVNTSTKLPQEDKQNRLPHERDQSPDSAASTTGPRDDMHQAAKDIEGGLVDTDLHGQRGVEKVKENVKVKEKPHPTKK